MVHNNGLYWLSSERLEHVIYYINMILTHHLLTFLFVAKHSQLVRSVNPSKGSMYYHLLPFVMVHNDGQIALTLLVGCQEGHPALSLIHI